MKSLTLPAAIDAEELVWPTPAVGQTFCYHRPGVGRPLLLLHSINATPSAFEVSPFFDAMSLPMPLYAADLPGFGRSERRDQAYTPEFFATAIEAIIDEIGAGPVDVLALSTTCEFAARAALAAPDKIASLIMVSPTGLSRRRAGKSTVGPKVHRFLRTPLLGGGLFRMLTSRASIRFFLNMAFEDKAPQSMVDYAMAMTRAPGASHAPFYFLSGQMFAGDAVGDLYLPQQCPVMVLFDQDPNVSFNHLDEVLAGNANWRSQRIPDTHGLPHFEKPDLTADAVLKFLTEIKAGH